MSATYGCIKPNEAGRFDLLRHLDNTSELTSTNTNPKAGDFLAGYERAPQDVFRFDQAITHPPPAGHLVAPDELKPQASSMKDGAGRAVDH
jgi:hypothetical protein